jgi:hypothetical protein
MSFYFYISGSRQASEQNHLARPKAPCSFKKVFEQTQVRELALLYF